MLITTSNWARPRWRMLLGKWSRRLMHLSSMARMVSAAILMAGVRPALAATSTSLPYERANASAIWLRQELPIQTNRTRLRRGVTVSPGRVHGRVHRQSIRDERWRPYGVPALPARHRLDTAP